MVVVKVTSGSQLLIVAGGDPVLTDTRMDLCHRDSPFSPSPFQSFRTLWS